MLFKEDFEEKVKEIAKQIEEEWQVSGLSEGLYFDYAKEVAERIFEYLGVSIEE